MGMPVWISVLVASACRNEFAFNQVIAEQGEKLGELSAFALPPDN
jgi:hypothetical protein